MFLRSSAQFRGEGSQTITPLALRRFAAYWDHSLRLGPAAIDRSFTSQQASDVRTGDLSQAAKTDLGQNGFRGSYATSHSARTHNFRGSQIRRRTRQSRSL